MKTNLPVTDREQAFPKGKAVVSKTDLKGIITYANDAFVELSGYTQEELVGKNHNMVRHPDMPPEAFADLWQTIKKNRPWRGIVKNRCKNGDHYWVDAMVVPIRENNQTVGYMSVRKEPKRDQVENADALYRQIRDKKAGLPKAFHPLQNLSIKTRFGMYTAIMLLLLVITGLLGMRGMAEQNEALRETYQAHLEPAINIAKIQLLMSENRAQVALAVQHAPDNPFTKLHDHQLSLHTDAIQRNAAEISRLWSEVEKVEMDESLKMLMQTFFDTRTAYVKEGIFPARQALLDEDFRHANNLLLTKIIPLYRAADESGKKLFNAIAQNTAEDFKLESQHYATQRMLMTGAIICGLLLGIFATAMLAYSIIRPLRQAIGYFDQIAQGHFDNDIPIDRGDEVGTVLAAISATQVQLRVITDEIRLATHAVRQRCSELEEEMLLIATYSQAQHDGVMQVSASMEEVSVSINEVATSADNAANAAKDSLSTVMESRSQMSHSLDSTSRVVTAVQHSSETIHTLSQSVTRIGAITQVIHEIAEQTNLLALNAAIEAARAGEQGRGFAVVADEVRKLAERTATSTADITKMVDEINKTTQAAVASMGNAAQEVESGRTLLQTTSEKFQQINTSSQHVTEMAEQIASAAAQQSSASEDVANNMEKMSALIEKNAAAVGAFKHSVAELNLTANELSELVSHFGATV